MTPKRRVCLTHSIRSPSPIITEFSGPMYCFLVNNRTLLHTLPGSEQLEESFQLFSSDNALRIKFFYFYFFFLFRKLVFRIMRGAIAFSVLWRKLILSSFFPDLFLKVASAGFTSKLHPDAHLTYRTGNKHNI